MRLLAQQGSQTGNKIIDAASRRYVQGVILSPKDSGLNRVKEHIARLKETLEEPAIFFDPQFYACFLAQEPECRTGKLSTDYDSYFGPRRRSELLSERQVTDDIKRVLHFQQALGVSALIGPNILIPRSFDSTESAISMNFIRLTRQVANEQGFDLPVFATLCVHREALLSPDDFHRFVNDLTVLNDPPDGFYLIVAANHSAARSEVFHTDVIAKWMYLNFVLKVNGFSVINGYSDLLSPFLGAAGGDFGATGWFATTRTFGIDRFAPNLVSGGRLPIQRYLSTALLNRLTFFELDQLRERFPQVVNGLPSDALYNGEGSEPNRIDEVQQSWDSLQSLLRKLITPDDVPSSIARCRTAVAEAKDLYPQIEHFVRLDQKSNDEHLTPLGEAVESFVRLAELG